MSIPLVTVDGRPRINPAGAAVLLAACLASCILIPSTIFWLALGDRQLVSTTLGVGLGSAVSTFTLILVFSLRQSGKAKPRVANDLAT